MPERQPSYGYTATQFPSPKLADKLLVEEYDHTRSHFGPRNIYTSVPDYGTEHPSNSGFRLTHVELIGPERVYRWYWVNDRASQDDYNYELSYPDGDTTYPLVQRDYLIRRSAYAAVAEGTADSTFAGCVLTRQRLVRLNDPVLDSLFVLVQRWYEKMPGKVTLDEEEDVESRVIIYTHRQKLADTALPPIGQLSTTALGATYANGNKLEWEATAWSSGAAYVIGAEKRSIPDSDAYIERIVQYCAVPPTRYEYPSTGFVFPGVYDVLINEWYQADSHPFPKPPFVGVHFTLLHPRSMSRPAQEKFTFFIEGSAPAMPELFRVVTPAVGSRFLDIPSNTVHPARTIYRDNDGDGEADFVVELYPASTPPTYNSNDVLLIQVEDATWRGRIKMRRELRISETRSPYTFP